MIQLNVSVYDVGLLHTGARFELSGLVEYVYYGYVPNGKYQIYRGIDSNNVAEPGGLVHCLLWTQLDSVQVRVVSIIPGYTLDIDEVIDRNGGGMKVDIDNCDDLVLLVWGIGEETKVLDLNIIDMCPLYPVLTKIPIEMPHSILTMSWNPY